MSAVIIYLVKVSLSLTIFHLAYHVLFRKSRHFQLNRFYLLYTSIIAFFLPLFPFQLSSNSIAESPAFSGLVRPVQLRATEMQEWISMPVVPVQTITPTEITLADMITYLYLFVAGIMLMAFLYKIWKIYRIIGDSATSHVDDQVVFRHPDMHNSSFFQFIFINRNPEDEHFDFILDHERVHARQWHSLDNMIMELVKVFQWYNPIVPHIQRRLHLTHEYIADEAVAQTQSTRRHYMNALISESELDPRPDFINSFHTGLKDRLQMLYNSRFAKGTHLHYLLALPILAILFISNSARLSEYDLLSATPGFLKTLDEPIFVYGDQSAIDREGPVLQWGKKRYLMQAAIPNQLSPAIPGITFNLEKSDIDPHSFEIISRSKLHNVDLTMRISKYSDGSFESSEEKFTQLSHEFSNNFMDELRNVSDKSTISVTGNIVENQITKYINVHFHVNDPTTKENYIKVGTRTFDVSQENQIPFGPYLPRINQVEYDELIDVLDLTETEFVTEGIAREFRSITVLESNGPSVYVDRAQMINRLLDARQIRYPVTIQFMVEGTKYFSVFDDDRHPSIEYQHWTDLKSEDHLSMVPAVQSKVKEDLSIKWNNLEIYAEGKDEYQPMLKTRNSFGYKARFEHTYGDLRVNKTCKVTIAEVQNILMLGPEIMVNNQKSRHAVTLDLSYVDHIGLPFKTQLFYDTRGTITSRENLKKVMDTLKPGDFIRINKISLGDDIKFSSDQLPVWHFRFKIVE